MYNDMYNASRKRDIDAPDVIRMLLEFIGVSWTEITHFSTNDFCFDKRYFFTTGRQSVFAPTKIELIRRVGGEIHINLITLVFDGEVGRLILFIKNWLVFKITRTR